MTDWRTYRNGNPRQPWDLERLARHRAAKLGYRVHRSRRRKGPANAGKLMLISLKNRSASGLSWPFIRPAGTHQRPGNRRRAPS
jgi:hypothetical protein